MKLLNDFQDHVDMRDKPQVWNMTNKEIHHQEHTRHDDSLDPLNQSSLSAETEKVDVNFINEKEDNVQDVINKEREVDNVEVSGVLRAADDAHYARQIIFLTNLMAVKLITYKLNKSSGFSN